MFQTVHTEAGSQHQDQDDKEGGQKLLPLVIKHIRDNIQRVVISVDPEQTEDPYDTEETEHRSS